MNAADEEPAERRVFYVDAVPLRTAKRIDRVPVEVSFRVASGAGRKYPPTKKPTAGVGFFSVRRGREVVGWAGAVASPRPPKNRTCSFHRIRLKPHQSSQREPVTLSRRPDGAERVMYLPMTVQMQHLAVRRGVGPAQ